MLDCLLCFHTCIHLLFMLLSRKTSDLSLSAQIIVMSLYSQNNHFSLSGQIFCIYSKYSKEKHIIFRSSDCDKFLLCFKQYFCLNTVKSHTKSRTYATIWKLLFTPIFYTLVACWKVRPWWYYLRHLVHLRQSFFSFLFFFFLPFTLQKTLQKIPGP